MLKTECSILDFAKFGYNLRIENIFHSKRFTVQCVLSDIRITRPVFTYASVTPEAYLGDLQTQLMHLTWITVLILTNVGSRWTSRRKASCCETVCNL